MRSQGLGIPWPLLGCPCRPLGRLKIPELWRRGSRWWDIGGLGLVRQWIHGLRQLLGAFGWYLHVFYVMVFSYPEVAPVHSRCFSCLPEPFTFGNWTLHARAPRTWQFLFAVWVCTLHGAMVQQWVHIARQLLMLLEGFLREEDLES